jgi:hypothetical protein
MALSTLEMGMLVYNVAEKHQFEQACFLWRNSSATIAV